MIKTRGACRKKIKLNYNIDNKNIGDNKTNITAEKKLVAINLSRKNQRHLVAIFK